MDEKKIIKKAKAYFEKHPQVLLEMAEEIVNGKRSEAVKGFFEQLRNADKLKNESVKHVDRLFKVSEEVDEELKSDLDDIMGDDLGDDREAGSDEELDSFFEDLSSIEDLEEKDTKDKKEDLDSFFEDLSSIEDLELKEEEPEEKITEPVVEKEKSSNITIYHSFAIVILYFLMLILFLFK